MSGADGIIEIVRRSNQRGGRMLSLLDLLDAGTLRIEQAAWLLERVAAGSSWLVGARPGGAGKTTIMGSLLTMLPAGTRMHLAGEGTAWKRAGAGECAVAYEIGAGDYEGYVWGEELRAFAALGSRGCRIVSNLHADTIEQARDQLVRENGVPEADFGSFDLFLPIRLGGSGWKTRPVVPAIWRHAEEGWRKVEEQELDAGKPAIRRWLEEALAAPARSIEEVRAAWLAASGAPHPA